ncbi:MAG: alpha/beta fold hydrolase [Tenuifilaceae bacterium]
MGKYVLTICLLTLVVTNLFSQNTDNNNTISRDSGFINVDSGKLYYEAAGIGENLVLLHDGMVHLNIWDEQFLVLAKKYRVVRYDRRNYGKSTDPVSQYSHIEDLNQLFVQLKIDKAVVFGMSSGGRLAIDFTLKYPEKVKGLVLVGAVVGGYGYTQHFITRGGRYYPKNYSNPDDVQKYFATEDPYEIYPENKEAKQKVLKMLESTKPSHDAREKGKLTLARPAEKRAVKFLSEIKVPALVLVGEFDIPDVHAHAGVINAGIENSKRVIILKSGHLIPIEQPVLFNEVVMKFLDDLSIAL